MRNKAVRWLAMLLAVTSLVNVTMATALADSGSEGAERLISDGNAAGGTTTPVDNSTTLPDGTYSPESFQCASGDITCSQVTVAEGKATAVIGFGTLDVQRVKAGGGEYAVSEGTAVIPVELNKANRILTVDSQGGEEEYTITIILTEPEVLSDDPESIYNEDGSLKPGVYSIRVTSSHQSILLSAGSTSGDGVLIVTEGGMRVSFAIQSTDNWQKLYINGAEKTRYLPAVGADSRYTLPVSDTTAIACYGLSASSNNYKAVTFTFDTSAIAKLEAEESAYPVSAAETVPEDVYSDGDYVINIESDFSMFKITSQSAVVKNNVVTVTIGTSKTTYDKIYLGSKNDEQNYPDYVQGVLNDEGTGYNFTFELPKSYMGQTIDFVPGKPDGSWYSKNQYHLTIPEAIEEKMNDGDYVINIESDFSMFKITSQSAVVKNNVVTVTIGTSKTTYDKIYLGSKNDEQNYPDYVQGVLNDEGTGYNFTFELPKSYMGQTIDFVPGKPDGSWYSKNQYHLTIPEAIEEKIEDGEYTIGIQSSFSMFQITSESVVASGNKILVTIGTSKTTYDKIYLGSNDDAVFEPFIQGVLNDEGTGYNFTFELPRSFLGASIDFVPGKPNGQWYIKNQYQLTIPAAMEKVEKPDEGGEEDAPLTDGEYTADVELKWAAFKLLKTTVTVTGENMEVTLISGQLNYHKIYLGSKDDAEATMNDNAISGVLTENNTAYAFTFTLPVTALGTTVSFVPFGGLTNRWMLYDYSFTLPEKLTPAVEETPIDINSYADGEYTGTVKAYTVSIVDGQTVYNSNAAFSAVATFVTIHGDTLDVTIQGPSSTSLMYDNLYLGDKESAAAAGTGELIPAVLQESQEGGTTFYTPCYSFTLPRSAMGTMVTLSAHSVSRNAWYQYAIQLSKVLEPVENMPYEDGNYTIAIESSYAMFKIAGAEAAVKDGKITVTMKTSSPSYDKLYLGSKDDAAFDPVIQGTANDLNGYSFTFELPVSWLGQTVDFVPGKPDGTWYTKNQYQLTIPAALEKIADPDPGNTGGELSDGDYTMNVESSASMFKVVNCLLTVKDGKYTAVITLSGTGYDKLFMGTGAEAETADASGCIPFVENEDGQYTYTIPVAALDTPINVAAHSIRNQSWYDRQLTFLSATAEKVTEELADGDYTVDVESSASMFKVINCLLTVKDGKYTAVITLSGTGYDKLFMGTGAEAETADASGYIPFVENEDGQYTYTIPVAALDTPIDVAAHSIRNQSWYDRQLTFKSETIQSAGTTTDPDEGGDKDDEEVKDPEEDLTGSTARVDNSTSLPDGTYAPDRFAWSGGSGRTSITCTGVTVVNGKAMATIVFSSDNFGYVKANGQTYYGSHGGGTSTFTIPVKLNANNTIIGMTTAMTAAHEVTYTIYVYIEGAEPEDENAEILGLTYVSTDENDHARLFEVRRFEEGYVILDVEHIGRYLLVPEGKDVPLGLAEDIAVVQLPVENTYVTSEELLEKLLAIDWPALTERLTLTGFETGDDGVKCAGPYDDPDWPALVTGKCAFAILPEVFGDARVTGRNEPAADALSIDGLTDEQAGVLKEVLERMDTLGISVFTDLSALEETEEAALEWIKLYGILFACEKAANAYYEKALAELENTAA